MIGSQLENQPTTQGRILGTPFTYKWPSFIFYTPYLLSAYETVG